MCPTAKIIIWFHIWKMWSLHTDHDVFLLFAHHLLQMNVISLDLYLKHKWIPEDKLSWNDIFWKSGNNSLIAERKKSITSQMCLSRDTTIPQDVLFQINGACKHTFLDISYLYLLKSYTAVNHHQKWYSAEKSLIKKLQNFHNFN